MLLLQRGEMSEAALLADTSAFHVRLTPMVEGSTWTSDGGSSSSSSAGSSPPSAAGTSQAGDGGSSGSGGGAGAAHDATEL